MGAKTKLPHGMLRKGSLEKKKPEAAIQASASGHSGWEGKPEGPLLPFPVNPICPDVLRATSRVKLTLLFAYDQLA